MGAERRYVGVFGTGLTAVVATLYWDDIERLLSVGAQGSENFQAGALRSGYPPGRFDPGIEVQPQFSGSGFSEPPAPFSFIESALQDIKEYTVTTYADVDQIVLETPNHEMVTRAGRLCPGSLAYADYRIAHAEYIKSKMELTNLITDEANYIKTNDLTRTEVLGRVSVIKSEIEARHQDLLHKAQTLKNEAMRMIDTFHPQHHITEYSQRCA